MIDQQTLRPHFRDFAQKKPFSFAVVDDCFPTEIANQLSAEFPDFDDSKWHEYKNQIEFCPIFKHDNGAHGRSNSFA